MAPGDDLEEPIDLWCLWDDDWPSADEVRRRARRRTVLAVLGATVAVVSLAAGALAVCGD